MNIRFADLTDKPAIVAMLHRYKKESLFDFQREETLEHAEQMYEEIVKGLGVCILVEDDQGPFGFILAIRSPNLWAPETIGLSEMVYWLNPEKRGGRAGYMLLKAYVDFGNHEKFRGTIKYFTISKTIKSPDIKYDRFGFSKIEETWFQ